MEMKQDSEYLGNETTLDEKNVLHESRKRIIVRGIIESETCIMYRYAEDFEIKNNFIPAIDGHIDSAGSLEMHTGIRDGYCE